jgi:hypothetical protein
MRIRPAVVSGAAVVLLAGAGAAYAVVDQTAVSPTETGNVLPIDSNHRATAHSGLGDDRSGSSTGPAAPSRADDGPPHH